jgi:acyl-CoA thioesterase-1
MRIPGRFLLQLAATFVISGTMAIVSAAEAQIVAFGASQVAGTGVGQGEAFPAQLEAMLKAKGYNVSIANAGVYGSTTSDMLGRVDSAVPSGTTLVILDTSGPYLNNYIQGISQAQGRSEMAAVSARLKARGIKVIPESTSDISPRYRQADGKHLTTEGHRIVAARLLPQVTRALGAPSRH